MDQIQKGKKVHRKFCENCQPSVAIVKMQKCLIEFSQRVYARKNQRRSGSFYFILLKLVYIYYIIYSVLEFQQNNKYTKLKKRYELKGSL